MPILLILGLLCVFAAMWVAQRRSSLTRACRWRLDRDAGPNHHRCAACGATCDPPPGEAPRVCLRDA